MQHIFTDNGTEIHLIRPLCQFKGWPRVSTAKPWTSRKNRFGWNLACRGSFGWKDRISGRKGTRGMPGTPTHHFLTRHRFDSNLAYGGILTRRLRISGLEPTKTKMGTPTLDFWPKTDFAQFWYRGVFSGVVYEFLMKKTFWSLWRPLPRRFNPKPLLTFRGIHQLNNVHILINLKKYDH